jgi:hypothetical protein
MRWSAPHRRTAAAVVTALIVPLVAAGLHRHRRGLRRELR